MILLARPCRTTRACTEAPVTVGVPIVVVSPPTNRTRSSVTRSPAAPPSFSTLTRSPSRTVTCFPPVSITAYTTAPPEPCGFYHDRAGLSIQHAASRQPEHAGAHLRKSRQDLAVVPRADAALVAAGQAANPLHRGETLGDAVDMDRGRHPIPKVPIGRQRIVGDHERAARRLYDDNLHPRRMPTHPFEPDTRRGLNGPVDHLEPAARAQRLEILRETVADEPLEPRLTDPISVPKLHLTSLDPKHRAWEEPFKIEMIPVQMRED